MLQTRVGIATGLVVVGDLIGSGEAQERGIVGETPNLAARLQGIAEPNMVVIAESTRRLLGNLFELQDLGSTDLKGIRRASASLGGAAGEFRGSRFEALHPTGLTALIGREEESALLFGAGRGQRAAKVKWCCSPARRVSANHDSRLRFWNVLLANRTHVCAISAPRSTPTARFIRSSARWNVLPDLRTTTRAQVKLDKLDALLAQTSTSTQHAALIADMLSLPNDGRYPALELTPQQRRQKTLEALTPQMEALSASVRC